MSIMRGPYVSVDCQNGVVLVPQNRSTGVNVCKGLLPERARVWYVCTTSDPVQSTRRRWVYIIRTLDAAPNTASVVDAGPDATQCTAIHYMVL